MFGQPEKELMERLESLLNDTMQKEAEDAQLISGLQALMLGEEIVEKAPVAKAEAPEAEVTKEATKPAEKKDIKKQASVEEMSIEELLQTESGQKGFLDGLNRRALEIDLALQKVAQYYADAYIQAKEAGK